MVVFNADQVALLQAKEATYGTPDAAATLEPVRMTNESLQRNSEFIESAELTPDAQVADQIRVDIGASGSVGFELSHGSFESLIASAFRQEAFTPAGGTLTLTGDGVADLDFLAADQSVARDSGSFLTDGWEIGMRYSITGSASNDGSYIVASVTALKITSAAGSGLVDEADVAATIRSGALMTATTIDLAAGDNSVNDSGNGFVDAGFVAGQWVDLSGSAADDGLYKIETVAAGKMVLSFGTLTTEAAGSSMTLTTRKELVNGTRLPSHSFERRFLEATSDAERYVQFTGMAVNSMSLEVTPKSVVGGEFGLIGKDEVDGAGASFGAGDAAASTTRVLDAVAGVSAVFENGSAFKVTNISMALENGIEALSEVGTLGAAELSAGKFKVSGSITIYYRDKALFDKYLGNTETSLQIQFTDSAGNIDILDLPRVLLTDGARAAGGTNTPIEATFTFGTAKHAIEGKTARWVSI